MIEEFYVLKTRVLAEKMSFGRIWASSLPLFPELWQPSVWSHCKLFTIEKHHGNFPWPLEYGSFSMIMGWYWKSFQSSTQHGFLGKIKMFHCTLAKNLITLPSSWQICHGFAHWESINHVDHPLGRTRTKWSIVGHELLVDRNSRERKTNAFFKHPSWRQFFFFWKIRHGKSTHKRINELW